MCVVIVARVVATSSNAFTTSTITTQSRTYAVSNRSLSPGLSAHFTWIWMKWINDWRKIRHMQRTWLSDLLLKGSTYCNKKHLKNVGPIRHNEPPHAHSPDVASGTVARRLRIDVHDDNDKAWQRGPLWPHGMGPMRVFAYISGKWHGQISLKFSVLVSHGRGSVLMWRRCNMHRTYCGWCTVGKVCYLWLPCIGPTSIVGLVVATS